MESEEQNITRLADVQNSLYYMLFTIQTVAAAVSIVVIIGLLKPLLIQLKKGTFHESESARSRSRAREVGELPYSTYNLYLVHLALVDLVFLLSSLAAEGRALGQNSDSLHILSISDSITPSYTIANLFLNAFIVREVLNLLRASKSLRRITQPSLTKVNLQAGIVIFLSLVYGLLSYYSVELGWAEGQETALTIFGITCLVPLGYVVGVTILVKWKAYLPPIDGATPRDKAVRGLARYFFRVILVFIVIWLPAAVLSSASRRSSSILWSQILLILAQAFMAFQPILTFCMILTKPDVKKYIKDLVTPTCVRGEDLNCCSRNRNPKAKADEVDVDENGIISSLNANQGVVWRNSATMLGYSFSGVDDDSEGEQVDTEEHENVDMETGCTQYQSHRVGGGPVAILTTGEVVTR